MRDSCYYDHDLIDRAVSEGSHREVVGGMWDEIGKLQFDFLRNNGLKPGHTLVDIGCGSLRGGVYFARYLNAGNYFGLDLNETLLDAGYEKELKPLGLDTKVPRENLVVNREFDFSSFGQMFDYALALSLFTHLSLNAIRTCLERLIESITTDSVFYATVFEADSDRPLWRPSVHEVGGITTFGDRDPFHYRRSDLEHVAATAGWRVEWIGSFGHPRDQKIVKFSPVRMLQGNC